MAYTALSVQTPKSLQQGTIAADGADLVMTAVDTVNQGNKFLCSGRDILIAQNTHASSPYTITLVSVPDENGRTGDVTTYSLAAGEIACFGPFFRSGWAQKTGADAGQVYISASNAAIKVAAIKCEF